MKSLRENIYAIKNTLDCLDPNRSIPVNAAVAKDAWTDIQMFILQAHAQVNVLEDVFTLIGKQTEVSE